VLSVGEGGVPIHVADVAAVSLGPALQRGQADLNGEGVTVGGIVVMRYGGNALDVIDRVKDRIEELRGGPSCRRRDRAGLRPLEPHRTSDRDA
jgi:copper/silver efflux system protein